MNKFRSMIMLLLMSAVIFVPLKLPNCPKQSANAPVILSFAATPCSVQQVIGNSCFSTSYWLHDELHLISQLILPSLIGLLSFFHIFSKYTSPLDEIYRPPI